MRTVLIICCLIVLFAGAAAAQERPEYYELDPAPYDPAVDVNMDLFMSHWKESMPRAEFGSLILRDIFTANKSADPLKPLQRSAVLDVFTVYAHGTLQPGTTTTPATLEGEQRVFYILDGEGTIRGGRNTADLYSYVAAMIPAGLEFEITNTGAGPLTMIVVGEQTPDDFEPRNEMLIRDENTLPISSTTSHWVNINKSLFTRDDGFAALTGMSAVWLSPMTMAQPHASRGLGTDVLWVAIEGDIHSLVGKKLHRLEPGSAYKNPSDGRVYHANINVTGEPIKLLWTRSVSPQQWDELMR